MEFSEHIKTANVEDVVLTVPFRARRRGALCVTGHHLLFSVRGEQSTWELLLLLRNIDAIEKSKMASDWKSDIKQLIESLAEKEDLKVVAKNASLGIAIGAAAAGAGVIFGPPGVLAGAAVGGLALALMNGGIKPLPEVLKNLSDELKEKLYNGVKGLLEGVIWRSMDVLLNKVLDNPKLTSKITDFLRTFFEPLHMMILPKCA